MIPRRMRVILLDLLGDPSWAPALESPRAYVRLASPELWCEPGDATLVIDARGKFESGVSLARRLKAPRGARLLVTEHETPAAHEIAYRAGVDGVIVMGLGEARHAGVVAEIRRREGT